MSHGVESTAANETVHTQDSEQDNQQGNSTQCSGIVKPKSSKAVCLKRDQNVNFKVAGDETEKELFWVELVKH